MANKRIKKKHKGVRLELAIRRNGMTQDDVAKMTKKTQARISQIMNGDDLLLSTAQEIALAVGETVDYLWPNYFH